MCHEESRTRQVSQKSNCVAVSKVNATVCRNQSFNRFPTRKKARTILKQQSELNNRFKFAIQKAMR